MPHPAALGGDSEEAVSDINDMLLSGPIPDEVAEWAPEKVATPLTTEEVAAVSMGLPWHDIPRTVGTTTGKSVDFCVFRVVSRLFGCPIVDFWS